MLASGNTKLTGIGLLELSIEHSLLGMSIPADMNSLLCDCVIMGPGGEPRQGKAAESVTLRDPLNAFTLHSIELGVSWVPFRTCVMVRTIRGFKGGIEKPSTESHLIHLLPSNFLSWPHEALYTQNTILSLSVFHLYCCV